MVVAQLAERSLLTPEDRGLNPALEIFVKNIYLLLTVEKMKKDIRQLISEFHKFVNLQNLSA